MQVCSHAIAPRHIPAVARVTRSGHEASGDIHKAFKDTVMGEVAADTSVGMEEIIVMVGAVETCERRVIR